MNTLDESRLIKILLWHFLLNVVIVGLCTLFTQNLSVVFIITLMAQPLALTGALSLINHFASSKALLIAIAPALIIAFAIVKKFELPNSEPRHESSNMTRINNDRKPDRTAPPAPRPPKNIPNEQPPSQRLKAEGPANDVIQVRRDEKNEDINDDRINENEDERAQPFDEKRPMVTRPFMDAKAMATATLGKLREAARRRDCIEIESLTKEITEHIEIPSDLQERVNKVGCP
jgi:hypothetical protein